MADSTAKAAARARLSLMVAATARPTLGTAEMDILLDGCRTRDVYGRSPSDAGWQESWDLNAGAAEGWRIKAGIVAADFSFTADDASYQRGEILASMEAMVAMYAAKVHGSTIMSTREADRQRQLYPYEGELLP